MNPLRVQTPTGGLTRPDSTDRDGVRAFQVSSRSEPIEHGSGAVARLSQTHLGIPGYEHAAASAFNPVPHGPDLAPRRMDTQPEAGQRLVEQDASAWARNRPQTLHIGSTFTLKTDWRPNSPSRAIPGLSRLDFSGGSVFWEDGAMDRRTWYPPEVLERARPTIQTAVVMSVTRVEKHALVPDDILQQRAVGERSPAHIVPGEERQVEPVPRQPVGTARQSAPAAFDIHQRRSLPEGTFCGEDRHCRPGIARPSVSVAIAWCSSPAWTGAWRCGC